MRRQVGQAVAHWTLIAGVLRPRQTLPGVDQTPLPAGVRFVGRGMGRGEVVADRVAERILDPRPWRKAEPLQGTVLSHGHLQFE